jgi:hypothetical protein
MGRNASMNALECTFEYVVGEGCIVEALGCTLKHIAEDGCIRERKHMYPYLLEYIGSNT